MCNHQTPAVDGSPLYELLASDVSAKEYFLSLPDHVRGGLEQHTELIKTADDLKQMASQFRN